MFWLLPVSEYNTNHWHPPLHVNFEFNIDALDLWADKTSQNITPDTVDDDLCQIWKYSPY